MIYHICVYFLKVFAPIFTLKINKIGLKNLGSKILFSKSRNEFEKLIFILFLNFMNSKFWLNIDKNTQKLCHFIKYIMFIY